MTESEMKFLYDLERAKELIENFNKESEYDNNEKEKM